MRKVVVITGASAGIGLEIAKQMIKKEFIVYSLSRRIAPAKEIITIETDVTNPDSVKKAISKIFEQEKRIDILINNAGMGISGSIEDTILEDAKYIFDVNFFGAFLVSREVVPIMRTIGGGTIVNVSSVAASISIPFQSFYSATKAALTSLSDSLRSEVKPFNIKVVTALPGDVKTDFTVSRKKNKVNSAVYESRIEKSVATMEKDEQNGIPSNFAAKVVVKMATKKNPPLNFVIGGKYKIFVFLLKVLPQRFVRFIVDKMYG